MANNVVHFEVMGADGEALRGFYSELFGWSFSLMEGDADYGVTMAPEGGPGIGGGVGTSQDGGPLVTVYVAVDDPQAYLDKAEAMGGATVMPLTEIPGVVTFALFKDPQGNVVGVVKDS